MWKALKWLIGLFDPPIEQKKIEKSIDKIEKDGYITNITLQDVIQPEVTIPVEQTDCEQVSKEISVREFLNVKQRGLTNAECKSVLGVAWVSIRQGATPKELLEYNALVKQDKINRLNINRRSI